MPYNIFGAILRPHFPRLANLPTDRRPRMLRVLVHRIGPRYIHSENMIEDYAIAPVDEAACFDSSASKKRKMATPKSKGPVVDLTQQDETQINSPPTKKKKGASSRKKIDGEKRLRRFRPHAPSSYLERLNRATTQR